jgi:alpha-L-fucosidase 2
MMKSKLIILTVYILTGYTSFTQDLKLWYNKPAVKWTEALPIGNGRIGAMLFGGVEQDRIQFNEETIWTGGPRDYNKKGAWKYLDTIRQLLFNGKQKEAEALAEAQFMGTKSADGERADWLEKVRSLKGLPGNPAVEQYDDSEWEFMQVPTWDGWEQFGFDGLDGAVWLRTGFELPDDWNGKDLTLDLNRVRDMDYTYVNGKMVGSMSSDKPRLYTIPKDVLHPGVNVIAIQVINFGNKGGVYGYKDTTRHIGVYPVGKEKAKLSLNGEWRYFVQDKEPPPVGEYQASYQPFGDLWLKFEQPDATDYRRELDISNAIASTFYTVSGVQYKREYFVSAPNQAMVTRLTASAKGALSFEASLGSTHQLNTIRQVNGNTISLAIQVRHGAIKAVSQLQLLLKGGKLRIENGKMIVTGADEAILYLTAGTNYKNYKDISADPVKPCVTALASLKGKTYEAIKAAHVKEYKSFFDTYSISLGNPSQAGGNNPPPGFLGGVSRPELPTDERLANFATADDPSFVALYQQYGRYLLIASSRPGTRPANLQGIWNDLQLPPWGSKYTTNINAEMNYWPAELLNLSPMHEPMFGMITDLSQTGKVTAKEYYNAPGWVLHHNTDLWRGTSAINASNHGIWVTGGAWMTKHLWEHYLFTQDKVFLKNKAYPIMREAARFFSSFLVKDPVTGYLISTPSNSPEQGGLVAGPTMDHQIIRALFSNVIAAADILKVDHELKAELQDKYKRIAPNKIGKYGQLQEWMQDRDDTTNKHRHISHLWGMYPGNEINYDADPKMMQAAKQSLLYRGDAATGWSLGWKINCWARFKDGDHTFKMIQMLMSPANGGAGSYPNLFDAHPPFQIDGNFGGAAGIGEMLVQSHTKYIDILPALPSALPDGTVKGICARGGFVLNMQWQAGKLVNLEVLSKVGQPLVLRYNGKIKELTTIKNKSYRFNASLELL